VTDLTVSGGTLTGGRKGTIFCAYNDGANSISNVNLVGNSSAYDGGAVGTLFSTIRCAMIACTFLGNVSAQNGGAVSIGVCEMTDCRVEANVAATNAGAVLVRNYASLVRTKVVGNRARTGGGVYVT